MRSYSFNTNTCCINNSEGKGKQGPTGPAGVGPIGPAGYPGPSAVGGFTGPTGQGCTGPTGPIGPFTGLTGSTGPPGSFSLFNSQTLIPLTYIAGQPLILPIPNSPITYYSVSLNNYEGITQINASNLPSGYQAIIFVSVTGNSPAKIQITINGVYNLFSNLNTTMTCNFATITIYSNAGNFLANIIKTQT